MGIVYLAESETGEQVALKLLEPDRLNPENMTLEAARQSYIEEIRLLKELKYPKHPHILLILDDGFQDDCPFLVTEYASRGSLADRLRSRPREPLPIEEAISILSQVGRALHHAHTQHDIVHRDLKPANIFFNTSGDALIADFGIAVVLDTGMTQDAIFAGSFSYMAPEQFQRKASKKSDQFSLGCIAYELVTGRLPFKNPHWWISKERPISPKLLNPQIPLHIEQAILKAMDEDRTKRHKDVFTFISALNPSKTQWLSEGDSYFKIQYYQEALSVYEASIKLDRYYVDAFIGRGKALSALGRDKETIAAYTQVIKLAPNNASAYHAKGLALLRLMRYDEALTAFEQAILLDPKNNNMYNDKGIVLSNLHRYEEALEAYEQAAQFAETVFQLDPKVIDNCNRRGCTLLSLERYEAANTVYEYVIWLDSSNPVAFYGKGVALYNLQRYDEALVAYERAIQLGSGNLCVYAYIGIGMIHADLKHPEESLIAFEQAIQLDSRSIDAQIGRGFTLSRLKNYEKALTAFERILQLDSKRAIALLAKDLCSECSIALPNLLRLMSRLFYLIAQISIPISVRQTYTVSLSAIWKH